MRCPLRTQILVPFGVLILIMLVTVSGINAYVAARQTSRRIEAQIASIAESVQASSYPLTESILRQTQALSGAKFIVTDEVGNVLAASIEVPATWTPPTSAGANDGAHMVHLTEVQGELYFHSAVCTQRGPSRTPQVLHILYPERVWRQARWQAACPPLLVGAAALAVVAGLSMTIAGRLSRPILQLQTQVSRIAQGRFEPLQLPRRNDELRDLMASVNSLVDDMVALRQTIQRNERLAVMGQLSGGLAHHLRNSVAGAKLALQLHQRQCREIDPESLAVAERQLRLTEEQLQRFLAAGQRPPPNRVLCDPQSIISELKPLVAPMCQHRKVTLRCESSGRPLPDVWADPLQLHEALLNLVFNAIEAAGPGGWVRVEVAVAGDSQVVLRVLDSGSGPSAEIRPRLFEPFVTGMPEGIGLGLAAAKLIAEAHGGQLRFAGEQPTCFELSLPCAARQ